MFLVDSTRASCLPRSVRGPVHMPLCLHQGKADTKAYLRLHVIMICFHQQREQLPCNCSSQCTEAVVKELDVRTAVIRERSHSRTSVGSPSISRSHPKDSTGRYPRTLSFCVEAAGNIRLAWRNCMNAAHDRKYTMSFRRGP